VKFYFLLAADTTVAIYGRRSPNRPT